MVRIAMISINKKGIAKYVVARHGPCPNARVMDV
jgi:hypothetical protein